VTHRPQQWFSPKNHGEGGSEHVQYRPQSQSEALLTGEREKDVPFSNHLRGNEPLDMPIESILDKLFRVNTYDSGVAGSSLVFTFLL
jgi:hypothetical protein